MTKSSSKSIVPLSELGKTDLSTAGGKGANLGELIKIQGLNVPAGFVITTAAYDSHVKRQKGLSSQLIRLAIEASTTTSTDTTNNNKKSTEEQIRALFLQGTFEEDLVAEIRNAYKQLSNNTNNMTVAVRSSATAEDLPTASFAGQQDTFLNIQGEQALLQAILKCWSSLWTDRAIAYRYKQGIGHDAVSMAVVVQTLVPATSAGVLFTANPMTGDRDEMVLNATFGLGEALVSGLVTPDTIVVQKKTKEMDYQVVSHDTAVKTTMTVRTDTGTRAQSVPDTQQTEQVLTEEMAMVLAQAGTQIEDHFGMPMDIEWAIGPDGKVAILQARAITSLPLPPLKNVVWETPAPGSAWMRRQIVEHMPEPLSPLFEDLYVRKGLWTTVKDVTKVMEDMIDSTFDMDAAIPWGFATTINGYAYTSVSMKMTPSLLYSTLRIYANVGTFFSRPEFDWEKTVLPRYQNLVAQWRAIDLETTKDETLLLGISELATEDSRYWLGSAMHLALSRLFDIFFNRLLKSYLIRYALPQPRPASSFFLRGFDSKALDAQADMEAMAAAIRNSVKLSQLVLNTPTEELLKALASHPEGKVITAAIQKYFDHYGHQIYNLDFAAPTQKDDPLPMLLSMKALVSNPPKQDVRTRQSKMAQERDETVEKIMSALNPLSRRIFAWVWKWTKNYGPYREHVMFWMGAGWPTVRQLARELGRRLTDAGVLGDPDDVYYLDSCEIETAIEARAKKTSLPDYISLARERRELRLRRCRLTPPPKVPQNYHFKLGPFDLSAFDPTPSGVVNQGPILNGYAVSAGKVTAPASVIHSMEDFRHMKPNTILVCTTTTPAWTPLFSQAVGLVTDVGGALAHGSIVAREYGIPAVMGTGVATERIRSGMMLCVDGDAGTVTLLDEANASKMSSQRTRTGPINGYVRAAVLVGLAAGGWMLWKKQSQ